MTENYLKTIIQYLIKIVDNSGISGEDIAGKLDQVIEAVSNIKISSESVNLNTDELEAKLDTLNQSVIDNGNNSDIVEKLTALGTKLDTINNKQDAINNNITSISQKMLVSGIINPTHIATVATGNTTFGQNVVLCNITNDNITVTVTAANDTTASSIVLAPGWNPVVVKSITGAVENTLVYGY